MILCEARHNVLTRSVAFGIVAVRSIVTPATIVGLQHTAHVSGVLTVRRVVLPGGRL
jgi:hypothetical protein